MAGTNENSNICAKKKKAQAMTEKTHNKGMQKKECKINHLKKNIKHCSGT